MPRAPLTIEQILTWADAHRERTGKWPTALSGPVHGVPGEDWLNINQVMCAGRRGFRPRQTTLAKVLAQHRGKRNQGQLPKLKIKQILAWADDHHARTGKLPDDLSGAIPGTEETWSTVANALRRGRRGLRQTSLARLLSKVRKDVKLAAKQPPSLQQILAWADQHHERTGVWPTRKAGPIPGSKVRNWLAVNYVLVSGKVGAKTTLSKLLASERGVPKHNRLPPLTVAQILAWGDEHFARTGEWPTPVDGVVVAAPEESWSRVDYALRKERRGLKGAMSLVQLWVRDRGLRTKNYQPPLTIEMIRQWGLAYKQVHGRWPNKKSGTIAGMQGDTWSSIRAALYGGYRGLPPRTTLGQVFRE
ncbi:hypothetical protein NA78x_003456 [Anatilimnocola sp. NA78]|uniref:hypothetical protein n=1 Tax=Anatilimnocola sp. NA78 TaxID=3415683 RepID=UPI003CE46417